jgi:hypothetical protein
MWKHWLHEAMYRKRPELWPNDWILHHDNAPANKTLSAKQFLNQKSTADTDHSPYLAPNDFWLLKKKREKKKGKKKSYSTTEFHKCFQQW